jgi:hypothetical protein
MLGTSFLVSPSTDHAFLSRRFSKVRSATSSFMSRTSRRRSLTSGVEAARSVSPFSLRFPASRNCFWPGVIQAFGNPLTTAEFCNAVFASQAFQYDPDFVFSRMVLARGPADVFYNLFGRLNLRPGLLSQMPKGSRKAHSRFTLFAAASLPTSALPEPKRNEGHGTNSCMIFP